MVRVVGTQNKIPPPNKSLIGILVSLPEVFVLTLFRAARKKEIQTEIKFIFLIITGMSCRTVVDSYIFGVYVNLWRQSNLRFCNVTLHGSTFNVTVIPRLTSQKHLIRCWCAKVRLQWATLSRSIPPKSTVKSCHNFHSPSTQFGRTFWFRSLSFLVDYCQVPVQQLGWTSLEEKRKLNNKFKKNRNLLSYCFEPAIWRGYNSVWIQIISYKIHTFIVREHFRFFIHLITRYDTMINVTGTQTERTIKTVSSFFFPFSSLIRSTALNFPLTYKTQQNI